MNAQQSGMAPDSAFRRMMGQDIPGDGVQPHSKGALYPCIIARIDRFTDTGEFRSSSWELSLDGFAQEYASRDDAEGAARHLLSDNSARRAWRGES